MSSERRTKIIRLLAEIDQDIAESRSLARYKRLTANKRREVGNWLVFYRSAVRHAELLLRKE